jgi:hypothetical protein
MPKKLRIKKLCITIGVIKRVSTVLAYAHQGAPPAAEVTKGQLSCREENKRRADRGDKRNEDKQNLISLRCDKKKSRMSRSWFFLTAMEA